MQNRYDKILIDAVDYQLDDKKSLAHIIGFESYDLVHLNIPETIKAYDKTYKVVSIKERAFFNNVYLEGVTIPPSIDRIEEFAFFRSSIQKVIFLDRTEFDSLTLSQGCFSECQRLIDVKLPDVLEHIPDFAFHLCLNLKTVYTPKHLKSIGGMAFCDCRSLEYFKFTQDIEEIAGSAFQTSNLNYVEVGEKIKRIDSLAFAHMPELKTVVILNPNASLNPSFINNDNPLTVYIKGQMNDPLMDTLKTTLGLKHSYVVDPFELVVFEGMKYLLFSKNVGRIISYNEDEIASNIIIPESIEGIPIVDYQPRFMKGSQNLITFQFPKSLKRVHGKAFDTCQNLEEVTFLSTVKKSETKWVVSNPRVIIIADNIKKEFMEYAILIQKTYISQYENRKVSEYLIQIFESDTYQEAMLKGLDYCIEKYSDAYEYIMIDEQPQKLIDLNTRNEKNSNPKDISLSEKRIQLEQILVEREAGISYTAAVFDGDNQNFYLDFIIQETRVMSKEEYDQRHDELVKYLIEACHTLYQSGECSNKVIWSMDS